MDRDGTYVTRGGRATQKPLHRDCAKSQQSRDYHTISPSGAVAFTCPSLTLSWGVIYDTLRTRDPKGVSASQTPSGLGVRSQLYPHEAKTPTMHSLNGIHNIATHRTGSAQSPAHTQTPGGEGYSPSPSANRIGRPPSPGPDGGLANRTEGLLPAAGSCVAFHFPSDSLSLEPRTNL